MTTEDVERLRELAFNEERIDPERPIAAARLEVTEE